MKYCFKMTLKHNGVSLCFYSAFFSFSFFLLLLASGQVWEKLHCLKFYTENAEKSDGKPSDAPSLYFTTISKNVFLALMLIMRTTYF